MASRPLPVPEAELQTMRAVSMRGYGGPETLRFGEVSLPPAPASGEALVRVRAAGVNPFDAKVRRGYMARFFAHPPGHIPGCDVAGEVIAVGADVTALKPGDRVYGLLDASRPGAYAEQVVSRASDLRAMPVNLTFEEAAAIPMAACTAWHGLIELGGLKPGQRVLVHGGAGGVGGYAVQIGKLHGAWIAATASAGNLDYVRGLGADRAVDYAAERFDEVLSGLNLVLDPIGGDVGRRSYRVLKRGGAMLTVLRGDPDETQHHAPLMAEHGVSAHFVAFGTTPHVLDLIRPMFEDGRMRVPELTVLPLERAADAHRRVETGHGRGKIVLRV